MSDLPPDGPAAGADPLEEALAPGRHAGMVLRSVFGAFAGVTVGALGGALLGLLLAAVATKYAGAAGGAASAVLTGTALVFFNAGRTRPAWATGLWSLLGAAAWAALWAVGSARFGWDLRGTLLAWVLGAVVIAMPGSARGAVVRLNLTGEQAYADPLGKDFFLWIIVFVIAFCTRFIPRPGVRSGVALGLSGALGGALAGAIDGGIVGAFSGDAGYEAFRGLLGGIIGGAVLGAVGGLGGGLEVARRFHGPPPAPKDEGRW